MRTPRVSGHCTTVNTEGHKANREQSLEVTCESPDTYSHLPQGQAVEDPFLRKRVKDSVMCRHSVEGIQEIVCRPQASLAGEESLGCN